MSGIKTFTTYDLLITVKCFFLLLKIYIFIITTSVLSL